VTQAARDDALKQVLDLGTPSLLAANRQFHKLLLNGVPVQYGARQGSCRLSHATLS
jgi:type I restriction enzyme R subunit